MAANNDQVQEALRLLLAAAGGTAGAISALQALVGSASSSASASTTAPVATPTQTGSLPSIVVTTGAATTSSSSASTSSSASSTSSSASSTSTAASSSSSTASSAAPLGPVAALLASPNRNYLLDKDGAQVPLSSLEGKMVALFFSAYWCPPCKPVTDQLRPLYTELRAANQPFEIVYLSSDHDDRDFARYTSQQPWLSVPYSDRAAFQALHGRFRVSRLPQIVLLDEKANVISTNAGPALLKAGASAFPFKALFVAVEEKKTEGKADEVYKRLLASGDRDWVQDNKGARTPIASLAGKVTGLYFSGSWCGPCRMFTPRLIDIYRELKRNNKAFEIVLIPTEKKEEDWTAYFAEMPWLSVPYADQETIKALNTQFNITSVPALILLDENGTVITTDGRETVSKWGSKGYPWKPSAASVQQAREEKQTAESEFRADLVGLFRHLAAASSSSSAPSSATTSGAASTSSQRVTRTQVAQRLREAGAVPSAQLEQTATAVVSDVMRQTVSEDGFTLEQWLQYFDALINMDPPGIWSLTYLQNLMGLKATSKTFTADSNILVDDSIYS